MVASQLLIGLLTGVATGQSHNTENLRIRNEIGVQVIGRRNRQLQHDPGVERQSVDVLTNEVVEPLLRLLLVRGMDVDLRLEDRHQASGADLLTELELLIDDLLDAVLVVIKNDRALLGAEDVLLLDSAMKELVKTGDRLHDADVGLLVGQALVDLEEGDDALLLPQKITGGNSLDLTIHRHLEQNRGKNVVAGERRAGDDPGPHLVDQIKHLVLVVAVDLGLHPVRLESLRCGASGLVQSGNESGRSSHTFSLLGERISSCHSDISFDFDGVFQRTRKSQTEKPSEVFRAILAPSSPNRGHDGFQCRSDQR